MKTFSSTSCGHKHEENEDDYCVRHFESGILLAVADGIGSHPFGGSVARWFCGQLKTNEYALSNTQQELNSLNQKMRADFSDFEEFLESGASVSIVTISKLTASCCWAGDCPVFHLPANRGDVKFINASDHGAAGALTNYFMGSREFLFQTIEFKIEVGDMVIVASDGANLDSNTVAEIFDSNDAQETVNSIVSTAAAQQGSDDATIVSCRCGFLPL